MQSVPRSALALHRAHASVVVQHLGSALVRALPYARYLCVCNASTGPVQVLATNPSSSSRTLKLMHETDNQNLSFRKWNLARRLKAAGDVRTQVDILMEGQPLQGAPAARWVKAAYVAMEGDSSCSSLWLPPVEVLNLCSNLGQFEFCYPDRTSMHRPRSPLRPFCSLLPTGTPPVTFQPACQQQPAAAQSAPPHPAHSRVSLPPTGTASWRRCASAWRRTRTRWCGQRC